MSSGMVLFTSTTATRAADGGISPSIVSSAGILCPLSLHATWKWRQKGPAPRATNRRSLQESSQGPRVRGILGR